MGYVQNGWLLVLVINNLLTTLHFAYKRCNNNIYWNLPSCYALVRASLLSHTSKIVLTIDSNYPKSLRTSHVSNPLKFQTSEPFQDLFPKTLYIFIHQNRAKLVTMWKTCPKNPTVYNRFPPFACFFIALPSIACFDFSKSALVVRSGPTSNWLLFFDLFWNRSQNVMKNYPNHLSNRTTTLTYGSSRATQAFFQFSMNLSNVSFDVMAYTFTSVSFCKIVSTFLVVI